MLDDTKVRAKSLKAELRATDGVLSAFVGVKGAVLKNNVPPFIYPELRAELADLPSLKTSFTYCRDATWVLASTAIMFDTLLTSSKGFLFKNGFAGHAFLEQENVLVLATLQQSYYRVLLEVLESDYRLWLLMPGGEKYQMDLSLQDYIEFLMLSRGTYLGEPYLCPSFPKDILESRFGDFYSNVHSLFGMTPSDFPMCVHQDVVDRTPTHTSNFYLDLWRCFADDIGEGICGISPELDSNVGDRISSKAYVDAVELCTGFRLPAAYQQLMLNSGRGRTSFRRTMPDGRRATLQFLGLNKVFANPATNHNFDMDANWFIYGEKGRVPAFDGVRLFASSDESKFGMLQREDGTIEVVMIDSVENQRLVEMPESLRTLDGFLQRLLDTKGEFLLDEIPL